MFATLTLDRAAIDVSADGMWPLQALAASCALGALLWCVADVARVRPLVRGSRGVAPRDPAAPTPLLDRSRPLPTPRRRVMKPHERLLAFLGGGVIGLFLLPALVPLDGAAFLTLALAGNLAFWPLVVVHEIGHLLAGIACRFGFVSFRVGPLEFRRTGEGVRPRILSWSVPSPGLTSMLLPEGADARPFVIYLAGGAATNAVVAIASIGVASAMPSRSLGALVLDAVAFTSAAMAVANLIPSRSRRQPSDGAQIRDAVSGHSRAYRDAATRRLSIAAQRVALDEADPRDLADAALAPDTSIATMRAQYVLYLAGEARGRGCEAPFLERSLAASAFADAAEADALRIEAAIHQFAERRDVAKAEAWIAECVRPLSRVNALRIDAARARAHGDRDGALRAIDALGAHVTGTVADPERRARSLRRLDRRRDEVLEDGEIHEFRR